MTNTQTHPVRLSITLSFPEDLNEIAELFYANQKKLFLVGGCVRDAYLGVTPKDWDVATDATPTEIVSILTNSTKKYKILEIGAAFGVIKCITASGGEYEIATFRSDSYINRKADLESFKIYLKSLNNGKYDEFLNKLSK